MSKRVNNQNGVAIMMVLSAISLTLPVVLYFSLDSATNKLKAYNIEERAKAKINAESGLRFAMARLKLYKEAFNFLQKNEAAKKLVKQEQLDVIWNFPFAYPIPETGSLNAIQKDAIKKFHKETVLDGSFTLSINNISNKINLNLLRVSLLKNLKKEANGQNSNEEAENEYDTEAQLINAIQNAIESESETNDIFSAQYFGTEVIEMTNELKYYVSDKNSLEDTQGSDSKFATQKTTPKFSTLSSMSELYTLPSWPDDLTNLILNEFTVHGALMIDLNKITDKLFKILIPNVEKEDIEEFFKYKDNPDDPKHFNSLDDFKEYVVNVANLMSESDFTDRFNKFKEQGLEFGPSPTLFKVISSGTVGRTTYTLNAFVTIPAKPAPRKTTEPEEENNITNTTPTTPTTEGENNITTNSNENSNSEEKEETIELLEPRVVEIFTS